MEISISELEQVRNDYAELGRKLERERIIKLLGEHSAFYDGMGDVICSQCNDSRDYDTHLAALIKGEK